MVSSHSMHCQKYFCLRFNIEFSLEYTVSGLSKQASEQVYIHAVPLVWGSQSPRLIQILCMLCVHSIICLPIISSVILNCSSSESWTRQLAFHWWGVCFSYMAARCCVPSTRSRQLHSWYMAVQIVTNTCLGQDSMPCKQHSKLW